MARTGRSFGVSCGTLLAACAFMFSGSARADVERVEYGKEDYAMYFKDDPLHSGVGLPHGDTLRIPPRRVRVLLIRPRTNFVQEMLKSVEMM